MLQRPPSTSTSTYMYARTEINETSCDGGAQPLLNYSFRPFFINPIF